MPIPGIMQPEIICVDERIRLRRYNGEFDFAFDWYQDCDMVYMVDGVKNAYTMERLQGMYEYLNAHGEEYFIEIWENGVFRPIGDVTFWQEDMPIVIGDAKYRGHGIGEKVIRTLCARAEELGYKEIFVEEIYRWNLPSRRCFEKAGFHVCGETEKGVRMKKTL